MHRHHCHSLAPIGSSLASHLPSNAPGAGNSRIGLEWQHGHDCSYSPSWQCPYSAPSQKAPGSHWETVASLLHPKDLAAFESNLRFCQGLRQQQEVWSKHKEEAETQRHDSSMLSAVSFAELWKKKREIPRYSSIYIQQKQILNSPGWFVKDAGLLSYANYVASVSLSTARGCDNDGLSLESTLNCN